VLPSPAHAEGGVQHPPLPALQQYCLVVLGSVAQAFGGGHVQLYIFANHHPEHTKFVTFDVNM
jgi:hypothetical protein